MEIGLAALAEDADNGPGKELEAHKGHHRDRHSDRRPRKIGFAHPVIVLGPVVKADDRLTALGNSDEDAQQNGIHLGNHPHAGQGDVRAIDGALPVEGEGVVHGDLHQGHSELIEAGARPQGGHTADIPRPGPQQLPGEAEGPEVEEVAQGHGGREQLAQHGGQGGPLHAHIQGKDENIVQNGVEDGPRHLAGHRVGGTAVGPDELAGGGGKDNQGVAQGGDTGVGQGKGAVLIGGPEEGEQGLQEKAHQNRQGQPAQDHNAQAGARNVGGLLRPPLSHTQVEVGRASHAQQQGQGGTDGDQGKGDVGGRVAHHAHALADKNLVHNVVHGADQKADDGGHGKFGQ